MANEIVSLINKGLDIIAPIKTTQTRYKYAPYLSVETKEQMSLRDLAFSQYKDNPNEETKIEYKRLRNKVVSSQKAEKKAWTKSILVKDGNPSKNLWEAVKSISGDNKQKGITSLSNNGVSVTKPNDIANTLNQFFIDKVKNIVTNLPSSSQDLLHNLKAEEPPNIEELELLELTMPQLHSYINKMKKTPSVGSDLISGIVLNDVFPSIQRVVLHLVNLSLCSGIFPVIFKKTKVVPILKKGKDPLPPSSYRPVSNLCVIGKLIEQAMFDQLSHSIQNSNFFDFPAL